MSRDRETFMITAWKKFLGLPVLAAACSTDLPNAPPLPDIRMQYAAFTEWSPPINLGGPVNSAAGELNSVVSTDGLSLYLTCDVRCPGYGGFDIWVARRADVGDPWG